MEINRRFDVKRVLTHMSSATTDTIRWRHVSILVLFVLISGNLSFYHQLTAVYPLTLDNFSFIVSLGVLVAALILLAYCMIRLIVGVRFALIDCAGSSNQCACVYLGLVLFPQFESLVWGSAAF